MYIFNVYFQCVFSICILICIFNVYFQCVFSMCIFNVYFQYVFSMCICNVYFQYVDVRKCFINNVDFSVRFIQDVCMLSRLTLFAFIVIAVYKVEC